MMTGDLMERFSERWFRLLLRLYPADFRDEMGDDVVATYMYRLRALRAEKGNAAVLLLWFRALVDSLRNGPGERAAPAVSWRRGGDWGRDMELVWRRLVRAPVFVATMIGTLGVGLAAFGVVYTAVHSILIAPLPYDDPDDLYFVWRDYTWLDLDRGALGGTDIVELQQSGGVIEAAAAVLNYPATLTGMSGWDPTEISIFSISQNLFPMLGVEPSLGRVFREDEEGPDAPRRIVLTHQLWNRFGADREILGTNLMLNGQAHTVIGVLPEDFDFARPTSPAGSEITADAYVAHDHDLAATNAGNGRYTGLLRAQAGTSPEVVEAAVASVGAIINERDMASLGMELRIVGAREDLVSELRPILTVLGLSGLFLVLVLGINMATLLLTRASQREQEFAIARALGANSMAVVRATLLEGVVLGTLGGVAASMLAVWGTRVLLVLAPADLPRRAGIAVDGEIMIAIIGVGALVGLLAAALPAVWGTRTDMNSLLRNAAVRGGGGGHGRMRRGMVVLQVALSLVLLTTGGLILRSFEGLLRTSPGFETAEVLTMRVPLSSSAYPDDAQINALHERIQSELTALPGVTSVGAATALPMTAGGNQTTVLIPGAPGNTGNPDVDEPLIDYINARPGYFETLGIPLLEGTTFRPAAAGREAIIDRVLAQQFFPRGNAVGADLLIAGDTARIIGVVGHARQYNVHADGRGQVYLRNDQSTFSTLSFAIRTQRQPQTMISEVRRVLDRVDPQLALADPRTMDEIVGDSLREQRVSAILIGGFALGALLLAGMGLYGVVSAGVTRRRHEIAVRLALGADHATVLKMVVGEGARLVGLGVLLGAPCIYLASLAIGGVLVGVSPHDPVILITVAAGLSAFAIIACYLPARRVLAIDPGRSLRE